MLKSQRRGRIEIALDFLEACRNGIPITKLIQDQSLQHSTVRQIMDSLMEMGLVFSEIRKASDYGYERKTTYYLTTSDGNDILQDWKGILSKLPF